MCGRWEKRKQEKTNRDMMLAKTALCLANGRVKDSAKTQKTVQENRYSFSLLGKVI